MTQRHRFLICSLAIFSMGCIVTIPSVVLGQGIKPEKSIRTIRQHYARINKDASQYTKKERDLSGFSTEGGTLTGYYQGSELKKIVATYYGETGKAIKEFYFANGTLIFLLSTDLTYERPLMYDGKDTGKIASSTKERFYFNKGTLIQWLDPTGKPMKTNDTTAKKKSKEIQTDTTDLITRLSQPPTQ